MRPFCRNFTRPSASRRKISGLTLIALLLFTAILAPALLAQTAPKSRRNIVKMVDPEYPAVLRNGHFEGQVIIEATVLPNGDVFKAAIKGGNPMLSQYAAQAVMRWKYAPGPDKTIEQVTFHFKAGDR
jgi:TonB family protein